MPGKGGDVMQPGRGEQPHSTDPTDQDLPVLAMCVAGFLALAAAFAVTLLDPLVGVVLLACLGVIGVVVRLLLGRLSR